MYTGLTSRLPVGSVKSKRAFGRLMTFPATSATIARTDAAQTFAGTQTINGNGSTTGAIVFSTYIGSAGFTNSSSGFFGFSASHFAAASDTILIRKAAANFQFGTTDAAAPVAQTLSVQSVVAGTSNTSGSNWILKGSIGTGTGLGGDIIFQTAPAGASGTAQNTATTALTIKGDLSIVVANNQYGQLGAAAGVVVSLPRSYSAIYNG